MRSDLSIEQKLDILNWKVDQIIMSQADINSAVSAITALLTDVQEQTDDILTDVTAIQAQLAAGQPVSAGGTAGTRRRPAATLLTRSTMRVSSVWTFRLKWFEVAVIEVYRNRVGARRLAGQRADCQSAGGPARRRRVAGCYFGIGPARA